MEKNLYFCIQIMNNLLKNFQARFTLFLAVLLLGGWGGNVYAAEPAAAKTFTIVIDAGHGGRDAGALGKNGKEKNINLNVALALGRLFEQNCPEVRVVYTRKTDVFVSLQERANIANKAKADLFVSIHTNSVASGKSTVSGAETYTLGMHRAAENLEVAKRENSVITYESDYKTHYQGFDPNKAESYIIFELMQDRYMQESIKLAKNIQQQYGNAGRKNKGVHQAGFLVLRETSMPSVLTELGFISHPTEEKYLTSQAGVSELASCLYRGIQTYRKKLRADEPQTGGDNSPAETPLLASYSNTDGTSASNVPSVRPVATTSYNESIGLTTGNPQPQMPDLTRVSKQGKQQTERSKSGERLPPLASELNLPPEKEIPATKIAPAQSNSTAQTRQTAEEKAGTTAPEETVAQGNRETPAGQPLPPTINDRQTVDNEMKEQTTEQPTSAENEEKDGRPVFKIQLLTSDAPLKANDPRLKGLQAQYYKEKGLYKYTYGETTDYQEIRQLRKQISTKFKDTFIVAFIDGQRTDLSRAINISRRR